MKSHLAFAFLLSPLFHSCFRTCIPRVVYPLIVAGISCHVEPVRSEIAVDVGGVGHDTVGAASDATIEQWGGQVVGYPGSGSVELVLDVADSTEPHTTPALMPDQAHA